MKKFIFLISLLFYLSTFGQHLVIENIQNFDKYLPEEQIMNYLVDESEQIWLAGEGSFYHYNGFCNQPVNLGLKYTEYVNSVHYAGEDLYYILSSDALYSVKHPLKKNLQVQKLLQPTEKNDAFIHSVKIDSILYILSPEYLLSYNFRSGTADTIQTTSEKEDFLTLFASAGNLYISGNHNKSYIYNTRIKRMDTLQIPDANFYGFQPINDREFIAQSVSSKSSLNNYLIIFQIVNKKGKLKIQVTDRINLSFNKLINEEITFFNVINDHLFFVWTTNQGAFLVNRNNDFMEINNSTGLISNEIINVFYYRPMIVVLTPKGISYIKNPEIRTISREDGLPDDNIWAIRKRNNQIYIATSSGLGSIRPLTEFKMAVRRAPFFKKNSIYGLNSDFRGNLWISLGDFNGIYRINNRKIEHLEPKIVDDISFTYEFVPISKNQILLIGQKFVYLYDYKKFTRLSITDSLHKSDERITDVQYSRKDTIIYITTTQGIWKIHRNTLENKRLLRYPNAFASYIFKPGSYIISDGREKTYYIENGMDSLLLTNRFCSEKVYNICYLPEKKLIIITDNAGIHLIDRNFTFVKHINELNGMPVNETNQTAILVNGDELWVGTTKGVVVLDISNWKQIPEFSWNIRESISFFNFKEEANYNLETLQSFLKMGSDKNNFKINFTPIFPFSIPLFFTKLKITSKDLNIEKSGQFDVSLTNLPSGSYKIDYQFYWKNPLYTLSKGSFHLLIRPPYFKQVWFWILSVSVFVALIVGIFGFRSYRLKRINQKLSFMVKQQTEHIERMNSILEGVLHNINEIILVFNLEGDIFLKNGAIKDDFFANIKNVKELLPYLPEEVRLNIEVILQNQITDSIRASEPLNLNGQLYTFYFNPLLVDNKLEGYSLFLMNISQLLENEQLKVKIETLNQIFATFSHYLNNYLQSIVLYLDLYYFSPETFEIEQSFSEIKNAVAKIQMIIDNIEEILNSRKYQTMDYAGIKNVLIKLNLTDEKD
jgi:hypothetical protein